MDYANVGAVLIGGPFTSTGTASDTPGRRAIFVCYPKQPAEEGACAHRILSRIARLAYRRPVTQQDVQTLMAFFNKARRDGGMLDGGIQFALARRLVDP